MQQFSGVAITDNGDGTVNVQIGPSGYQIDPTTFFDRSTFDQDHLSGNMRLAHLIGNYGALNSSEYLHHLQMNSISLTDAGYYIVYVQPTGDGVTYTVGFSATYGSETAEQTVTMQQSDLTADSNDDQMIVKNIGSFFRLAGYTSLTPEAIAAVASRNFWY